MELEKPIFHFIKNNDLYEHNLYMFSHLLDVCLDIKCLDKRLDLIFTFDQIINIYLDPDLMLVLTPSYRKLIFKYIEDKKNDTKKNNDMF